ncbi:SRPBCC family protein [Costertonia aggregata]|uniref:SRPBCC family protein n=1 Tax=Costertonia aggregata TaxID=343403 RepID=A0A7H9AKG2_9FLAO|nr:SRPBCC family protein [Costertonia aggregata]QLG43907.1 SRPBCC family protein [Costertonia aggregata]
MYTLLYIIPGIALLVSLLAIIAPKSYDVSRDIEISKPKDEVFNYLKYLKNMDEWSPWAKKDPNMNKKLIGIDGEVGAISYWNGNKDVGEGEQEIKNIVEGDRIESELRFLKPWKSISDCYTKVEDVPNGKTKVIWGFTGENKFPMNIVMLFMSMDKMVGKDFEEGLSTLKTTLESRE